MRQIPDLLSMSRIALCLPLLMVDAMTVPFWVLNVIAGFLLFIGMMTIGQSYFVHVAWAIACIALFAAIQEGHFIRSK